VAIGGGLMIACAFLAFVAAHWTDLARLFRCGILLAGIIISYGIGAWFAHTGRVVLADLCASIGTIIFGAGIALIGQMYHLGGDFAAGMMLWAVAGLAAAALTSSRGAFAVALAAASIWTGSHVFDTNSAPHLSFVVFWFVAAGLALAWKSRPAVHFVALSALLWWIATALFYDSHRFYGRDGLFVLANGSALLFGAGLALAAVKPQRLRDAGSVLAIYGAFAIAGTAIVSILLADTIFTAPEFWVLGSGLTGLILAVITLTRQPRRVPAVLAIAFAVAMTFEARQTAPWFAYVIALCAVFCLLVSGTLDAARERTVAGWLGVAGAIASITWVATDSLLYRSAFLATAGLAAVVLATLLNKLIPGTGK